MVGAIRKRDIVAHPFTTIQCFGWYVFLRVLIAGRNQTFLNILNETQALRPATSPACDVVNRCIELECQAQELYKTLAATWVENRAAAEFFSTLAAQEQGHAELLKVCRRAGQQDGWNEEILQCWGQQLPQLEETMRTAKQELDALKSVDDALRLVLFIESSEVNQVFRGVISANDSEFVRKLSIFHETTRRHLNFICQKVSRLQPELSADGLELLSDFCSRPT
jgi:rubrerythrin